MAAIAGLYWNREDDDFEKVQVKDGKLQIELGATRFAVSSSQEKRISTWLTFPGAIEVDIHFVAATAEKPRHLEQSFGRRKARHF